MQQRNSQFKQSTKSAINATTQLSIQAINQILLKRNKKRRENATMQRLNSSNQIPLKQNKKRRENATMQPLNSSNQQNQQ